MKDDPVFLIKWNDTLSENEIIRQKQKITGMVNNQVRIRVFLK